MQRWVTTLVGLAVVVLAVWLVARDFQPPKPIGHDPTRIAARRRRARTQRSAACSPSADAAERGRRGRRRAPLLLSDLVPAATDRRVDGGVGAALPDGTPVPPLPLDAPRAGALRGRPRVVRGRAAERRRSASPSTRSQADAKALAEKLLATAQQDFHAAVQQGDAGSSDDVGRVQARRPRARARVRALHPGVDAVGGPVDTPRATGSSRGSSKPSASAKIGNETEEGTANAMATIDIRRTHTLAKDEAKKRAEELAQGDGDEARPQWRWDGDRIGFEAPRGAAKGTTGTVEVTDRWSACRSTYLSCSAC